MSLGSTQPFRPSGTVTIAASTVAATAALVGKGEAVLITNTTGGMAFIAFGTDLTAAAKITDTPLPPGARILMHAGTFASSVSVILGSGAGTVYVTRGDGTVY